MASDLDLATVLGRIVAAAADLADAHYAALGVLDESGTRLADFLTVGVDSETKGRIGDLPRGHGILGLLIVDPRPIRLPDLSEHPDSYGFPLNHPPMTSFLGVPIRVGERVFGNLYLTDKRSADVFSEEDEEVVVTLAAAAAVAIENARLHARVEALAVVEDRERIARDLHDTVIQRLFAAGLALQGTMQLVDHVAADRLQRTVDELDSIIREVRSVIFRLEEPSVAAGIAGSAAAVVADVGRVSGFETHVDIAPALDRQEFSGEMRHALLATLREALSNVVRHAQADRVWVSIELTDDRLTLNVEDDGRGLPASYAPRSGRGLANAGDRAARLGGHLELNPRMNGGTVFVWSIPCKPID